MSGLYRVSAKAVIIEDGRALLIRKPNGYWDLPGGRLEPGETLQDALSRETCEELSVPVSIDRLLHCGVREKDGEPHVVAISFLCRLKGGLNDIELSHEHEEARLFSFAETASLALDPVYRAAVERAFKEARQTHGSGRFSMTEQAEQVAR